MHVPNPISSRTDVDVDDDDDNGDDDDGIVATVVIVVVDVGMCRCIYHKQLQMYCRFLF